MLRTVVLTCGFLCLALATPALAQTSTICQFTHGALTGSSHDYAPLPALPVGTPCQDGAGSSGTVVARPVSETIAGGSPYGGSSASEPTGTGLSTICYFTAGPRSGQHQDYAPRPAIPIGATCNDGVGSSGVVR